MIARSTLHSSPGGDTVQILSTAKYLKSLGVLVDVKICHEGINYDVYNLIHFFNIIRPDDILYHISKTNIPFVISTVFVDYSEYEQNAGGLRGLLSNTLGSDRLEFLKAIGRHLMNGQRIKTLNYLIKGHYKSVRYVAKKARLLLPNSISEYNRFLQRYQVEVPYRPIVNAIDTGLFNDEIIGNPAFKDHILCVGRIEGLKNQLNLIKAVQGTEFNLTIIGKPSPNHFKYYQQCVDLVAGSPNIKIIEHLTHQELAHIYKSAKVHVLASWFETTGLSSLEAGIMDCNIVVSKKGDTPEYFGKLAYFCEPDDINSIRQALTQAYIEPVNPELKDYILKNYTWERAAQQTADAYNLVLQNSDLH